MGCYVIHLCCGGSGVCSTLRSCSGRVDGFCGTAMLNMDTNCFIAAICFYPRCGMGLDGNGLWSASVRSAVACVTTSSGERLGNLFCTGKSSIVSEMHYDDVLGM